MLTLVGLEFEGQPHSGLDDAKNIARVLLRLIADRAFVRVNEKIIIKVASYIYLNIFFCKKNII